MMFRLQVKIIWIQYSIWIELLALEQIQTTQLASRKHKLQDFLNIQTQLNLYKVVQKLINKTNLEKHQDVVIKQKRCTMLRMYRQIQGSIGSGRFSRLAAGCGDDRFVSSAYTLSTGAAWTVPSLRWEHQTAHTRDTRVNDSTGRAVTFIISCLSSLTPFKPTSISVSCTWCLYYTLLYITFSVHTRLTRTPRNPTSLRIYVYTL